MTRAGLDLKKEPIHLRPSSLEQGPFAPSKMIQRRLFSLFEIIIVVIIIAFIVGIAAVQLDSVIPSSRLKKQARETANLMELAITQAAIENKPLALVFNSIDRTLSLEIHPEEEDEDSFSNFDFFEEEEEDLVLYTSTWPESITLVEMEVDRLDEESDIVDERILFFPEGSCEGATVTWKEASGFVQTIELWPLLGRVNVLPLESSDYVY